MIEKFNSVSLLPGERLEDLGNGLMIIQNPEYFCFGIDAVLLTWFSSSAIKRKSKVIEIGTGTGIISLLLTKRTSVERIKAFEIQPHMAEMAKRSIKLNDLEERIDIICQDIKQQDQIIPSSLDVIVCNPPYTKVGAGLKNPKESVKIARHEICLTAEDLMLFSKIHLKDRGKLFLIQKAERLTELILLGAEQGLALKRLVMVHPRKDQPANLVLCEFVKGAKEYLKVENPIIVYEQDAFSQQIHTIYESDGPCRTTVASGHSL